MVMLASAGRAMAMAKPVNARMSATRAALPKIGLTRPVLVGQPVVSWMGTLEC